MIRDLACFIVFAIVSLCIDLATHYLFGWELSGANFHLTAAGFFTVLMAIRDER